jgi:hypothetical protein
MNATAATRRLPRAGLGCVALCAALISGCGFSPPQSSQEREALQSCRSDADRIYDAQNRYQLSERDARDTPFSGGGQVASPSDGLADQYSHERMVESCLHNGGSTGGTALPESTAPAAEPASAAAHTP